MSERKKGHRNNSVSPETANSRYASPLKAKQARDARKWIAERRMTHEQAAEHFGCNVAELVAKTEPKRAKGGDHGNAMLNIRPEDRDKFRRDHCLPDEAAWIAFQRLLAAEAYYRTSALAHGCSPYSGLSPEPVLPSDQVIH